MMHGGGHERGLRSGTLNVPGIVGMGKACELAAARMSDDAARVGASRNQLETKLLQIEGTFVNGNQDNRLYNVTNISFPGTNANALIGQLETSPYRTGRLARRPFLNHRTY